MTYNIEQESLQTTQQSLWALAIICLALAAGIYFYARTHRSTALAVSAWPTCFGEILTTKVEYTAATGKPYYTVTYGYSVQGTKYVGNKIRFDSHFLDGIGNGKEAKSPVDVHELVELHYNPKQPGDSVLLADPTPEPGFEFAAAIGTVGAVLFLVGFGFPSGAEGADESDYGAETSDQAKAGEESKSEPGSNSDPESKTGGAPEPDGASKAEADSGPDGSPKPEAKSADQSQAGGDDKAS